MHPKWILSAPLWSTSFLVQTLPFFITPEIPHKSEFLNMVLSYPYSPRLELQSSSAAFQSSSSVLSHMFQKNPSLIVMLIHTHKTFKALPVELSVTSGHLSLKCCASGLCTLTCTNTILTTGLPTPSSFSEVKLLFQTVHRSSSHDLPHHF